MARLSPVLLLILVLVLSACGSKSQDSSSSVANETKGAAPAAGTPSSGPSPTLPEPPSASTEPAAYYACNEFIAVPAQGDTVDVLEYWTSGVIASVPKNTRFRRDDTLGINRYEGEFYRIRLAGGPSWAKLRASDVEDTCLAGREKYGFVTLSAIRLYADAQRSEIDCEVPKGTVLAVRNPDVAPSGTMELRFNSPPSGCHRTSLYTHWGYLRRTLYYFGVKSEGLKLLETLPD